MRISKVLNNNSVITFDAGIEKIVMGKGIAFNKQPGDLIDESSIQKEFICKNDNFASNMEQLMQEVAIEQLEAVDEIVKQATAFFAAPLFDIIYLTLSDHINYAIKRVQENITLNNALTWDIQKFYPEAYHMAEQAVEIVYQKTGVQLPHEEAGFIAMHLVNALQNKSDMQDTYKMTKLINEILEIVERYYQGALDETSLDYSRFITHLQFFTRRIVFEHNRSQTNDTMLQQLQQTFTFENTVVEEISAYIMLNYQVAITESERVYLLIHLSRIKK